MMKVLLMTVMMLSLSVLSYAQYTINGTVRDIQSHEPLPGANILLGQNATSTDNNGQFQLDGLPSGNYHLKITFIGYETLERDIDISRDDRYDFQLKEETLITDEVIVSATRANERTPTTFTTVNKEEIEDNNLGQDLPYLLNMTPSLVTTSDAGAGVGYTGLRIRGSDATRINVTINGVPLNDSESQGVFWVDIPDIASSTENIQIQRGVGTSTNGAGAFGGTINLQTNSKRKESYGELINSFGSYNTWRHTLGFGTGIINDHWSFDGRLSKITSDGYIDRATSDLNSYYLSGGYYGKKTIVKAIMFGGKERTYQSWYGTPQAVLENDEEGIEDVIINNGLNDEEAENIRTSGRTFNWYLYDDQVDDYRQDHYQLHLSQLLADNLTGNVSLHYTYGRGYYEQYRQDDDFANYTLPDLELNDTTITSSDFIRRKWLDNDFYGVTYSLEYSQDRLNIVLGGAYNEYRGDHFGEIIWAEYAVNAFNEYRYYDNDAVKKDFNTFLKVNYQLFDNLNFFGDLQYRNIDYKIKGVDGDLRYLNLSRDYDFFNPKFGAVYSLSGQSNIYASYSVANREPVRSDFVDSPEFPEQETLHNIEAGYRRRGSNYQFAANYYLMDYKNQLVLTGAVNDVGSSLRTNVEESYRMGIELTGGIRFGDQLYWSANATLSRNKIKNFNEILYDYGPAFDEYKEIDNQYEDTDISFSPKIIAGSQLSYMPVKGINITLLSKYIGKQYLDNTSNENRIIGSYFVNDLRVGYTIKTDFIKEIGLTFQVNNIFDEQYSSNGYTFGYFGGEDYEVRENYYYPQAPRNFLASVRLKF